MIMMNPELISNIKQACVGIGILKQASEKELEILGVGGTGFIVDNEGFVVTANHVIQGLNEKITELKKDAKEGEKFGIAGIAVQPEDGKVKLFPRWMKERVVIDLQPGSQYTGDEDFDVAIGRMIGKIDDLKTIEIKKPTMMNVFDEILMCGYPGGTTTFHHTNKGGMRFSSVLQKGVISGFLPADNTKRQVGIQTDIVATGGSSGSPIIDKESLQVIGIQQKVIGAEVLDDDENYLGMSKIGLSWGVSNYLLYGAVTQAIPQLKEQLDDTGVLKPKYVDSKLACEIELDMKEIDQMIAKN